MHHTSPDAILDQSNGPSPQPGMPADYTIRVEKHNYGEPDENNLDLLKTPEKNKIN